MEFVGFSNVVVTESDDDLVSAWRQQFEETVRTGLDGSDRVDVLSLKSLIHCFDKIFSRKAKEYE